ncbi:MULTISPECIES: GNAT family N-acetyltransferase [unclassified Enterococcus]|jgi:ribosomal protein S18 acetylase RimI-like enzyme|uniref:GNAT family N-acetyltransferase n=1 Tax=unclassified Enterococcus TaxID=2608891 RepID=UPI003D2B018C
MVIDKMTEQQRNELRELYFISRKKAFFWEDESAFDLADFDHDTKDELVLVATDNKQIVGFISLYVEDNFIHTLFVSPEKQGLGAGTALLQEAKKVLEMPMKLKCLSKNTAALKFYESQGWRKIDEVKYENANDNYWNLLLEGN